MITYTSKGLTYRCRRRTILTPWIEHAVQAYGYLLNTEERKGKEFTWAEFAEIMTQHSSHMFTQLLALHLKAEHAALQKEKRR